MKRIITLVLLLLFAAQSFALTASESDYKWNKLDLKTRYSTQVSGSMSMYEGTGSGYVSSKDVESWYITKGGRTIGEVQYLRLLGDDKKADEIIASNSAIDAVNITSWIIAGAAFAYAFYDIFDGNDQYYGTAIGTIVGAIAGLYPLLNQHPAHYLAYEEVGPQIDKYNASLRVKLGLSNDIDTKLQ